jgi:hypothetical protein
VRYSNKADFKEALTSVYKRSLETHFANREQEKQRGVAPPIFELKGQKVEAF